MGKKKDHIAEILERRGIYDPYQYLEDHEQDAEIIESPVADVMVRGNVQLMMGATISRSEVEDGLKKLKYL